MIRIAGLISQWNNHSEGFKAAVDAAIAAGNTDVDVYLNTPGGDVFQANEIGNEIQRFAGSKTAILGALCASAGTYIASICDKVIAKQNSMYMIHKPWAGFTGNTDEIEAQLVALKHLQNLYAETYAAKTGMKVEEIDALWKQDYWMNAKGALQQKFIDEIEGATAEVTSDDIAAIAACGYKNMPEIKATVTTPTNQNQTDIMKEIIIAALALQATASEAQIVAALDVLKAKALKADELQKKLDETVKAANEARNKAILDACVADKRIVEAEREYYAKQLDNDFEATKAHLEAKPKVAALSATTSNKTSGDVDRSKWTYADYMEKDPKALAELAEKDEETFNKLRAAYLKG